MPDDRTHSDGVRWRDVESLERTLLSRLDAIDRRLDQRVHIDLHKSDLSGLNRRIDDLDRDVLKIEQDQAETRHTARQGKQWAVGIGVSGLAVLIAFITLLRSGDGPASLGAMLDIIGYLGG